MIGLGIIAVVGATWFGLFGFLSINTAYGTVQEAEEALVCDVDAFDTEFHGEIHKIGHVLCGLPLKQGVIDVDAKACI